MNPIYQALSLTLTCNKSEVGVSQTFGEREIARDTAPSICMPSSWSLAFSLWVTSQSKPMEQEEGRGWGGVLSLSLSSLLEVLRAPHWLELGSQALTTYL